MSRVVAALVAAVLAVALAGCDDAQEAPIIPGPGPSRVVVDSPELRQLKEDAGIEDCVPGPGGGALPAVTLACLGGGTPVDLSTLRGPMVLSLWFAGCEPCKEEMPALQAFHEQYGAQVPVLGLDLQDQYPASALEVLQERGVTYPSVADPGGEVQDHVEFAKLVGMPAMYFLDAGGAVSYVAFGGVDSEQKIVDLVREHLGVAL